MKFAIRTARARSIALCLAAAAATTTTAFAHDRRDDHREAKFIGVFYPAFEGFAIDPVRCPDASHPILFRFRGTANTTLGTASIVQSHCENADHTSFRRGEQEITLASGWKVVGVYSGRLLPTPTTATDGLLIVDGRYRFTGGSGPFKHADGFGTSAGTVNTRTGGAVITVSGTL
jgi:hypothetical protein